MLLLVFAPGGGGGSFTPEAEGGRMMVLPQGEEGWVLPIGWGWGEGVVLPLGGRSGQFYPLG